MSDIEDAIRDQAYRLWEQAGRPEGRHEEFWFAARQEMVGEADAAGSGEAHGLPAEEPPAVMAQYGVPGGMPGERVSEQGVLDDELEGLALPARMAG